MNRGQLVDRLADRTGLPRPTADAVVRALFHPREGLISHALRESGELALHGFGSFSVEQRPARTGRDPRSGAEIEIPARRACVFRPRQGLRKSMKDMIGG